MEDGEVVVKPDPSKERPGPMTQGLICSRPGKEPAEGTLAIPDPNSL
jgi:hypothetical protein